MIEHFLKDVAWSGDLLVLVAAYLITRGKRISYLVFILADLLLIPIQIYSHIWSQFALFVMMGIINVFGWYDVDPWEWVIKGSRMAYNQWKVVGE